MNANLPAISTNTHELNCPAVSGTVDAVELPDIRCERHDLMKSKVIKSKLPMPQNNNEAAELNFTALPKRPLMDSHHARINNPGARRQFSVSSFAVCNNSAALIQRNFKSRSQAESEKADWRSTCRRRAFDVLDFMMEEYMREELLPDLLTDILTSDELLYQSNPIEIQVAYATTEEIIKFVVQESLGEVIPQVIKSMVDNYLHDKCNSTNYNPVLILGEALTSELVVDLLREIVAEAIEVLVAEYIFEIRYEKVLNSVIQPMIRSIYREVRKELLVEQAAMELIRMTIKQDCTQMASKALQESLQYRTEMKRQIEFQKVETHSQQIMHSLMLKSILQLLVQKGDRLLFKEASASLLEELMLRRLVAILYKHANLQKEMQSSSTIVKFLNQSMNIAGFAFLLNKLKKELANHENQIHQSEIRALI